MLALAVLYVAVIGIRLDASAHDKDIADKLTAVLGREVLFTGPLQLEISAHPKLHVGGLHIANALAHDQFGRVLQRRADFFAARHFANAGATCVVGEDEQIAGEEGAVCAGEVHQHAVMPRYGDDAQVCDDRGSVRHGVGVWLS